MLIFVGRLGEEKSIDKLIENFARVSGKLYQTPHLLLVGDGPLKGKLQN